MKSEKYLSKVDEDKNIKYQIEIKNEYNIKTEKLDVENENKNFSDFYLNFKEAENKNIDIYVR